MVTEEYLLDRHEPPANERLRGTLQDITLADGVAVVYQGGAKVYIANKYPPDSLEEHMSVIEQRIDRPNYSYSRAWGDWVNAVKRAREEMLQGC